MSSLNEITPRKIMKVMFETLEIARTDGDFDPSKDGLLDEDKLEDYGINDDLYMTKVDFDGIDWVHMPGASESVGSIVTLGLETGFTKHFFSDFVIEDNGDWLDQLGRETDLDDRLSFFQSEEKLLGLCKRVAKAYNSIKNSRAVFVDHFNLAQAAYEMVENFQ